MTLVKSFWLHILIYMYVLKVMVDFIRISLIELQGTRSKRQLQYHTGIQTINGQSEFNHKIITITVNITGNLIAD